MVGMVMYLRNQDETNVDGVVMSTKLDSGLLYFLFYFHKKAFFGSKNFSSIVILFLSLF